MQFIPERGTRQATKNHNLPNKLKILLATNLQAKEMQETFECAEVSVKPRLESHWNPHWNPNWNPNSIFGQGTQEDNLLTGPYQRMCLLFCPIWFNGKRPNYSPFLAQPYIILFMLMKGMLILWWTTFREATVIRHCL